MEDKAKTTMLDFKAECCKLQEENYRLHQEVRKLKETIRKIKAANVAMCSIKATTEAFLKTQIDIDFDRINDYMKEEVTK